VAGNIPACRGCEIEAFCAGGCAADAFTGTGDIFHAAGNCEIEKSIFKALVRNELLK
jgi:radical SAM protein with 4Fe4S-binding SPASM domain